MSGSIRTEALNAKAFAPFGEVIAATGTPDKWINVGRCGRFHDLAALEAGDGRIGISLFQSDCVSLPYTLTLMERHPHGSQAFLPMSPEPFLVIVAPDAGGRPGTPRAFLTAPGQGINLAPGTWHGVLTPLGGPGLFAVVDRVDGAPNLEEVTLPAPWLIEAG